MSVRRIPYETHIHSPCLNRMHPCPGTPTPAHSTVTEIL